MARFKSDEGSCCVQLQEIGSDGDIPFSLRGDAIQWAATVVARMQHKDLWTVAWFLREVSSGLERSSE
jgi:hypothetical protein